MRQEVQDYIETTQKASETYRTWYDASRNEIYTARSKYGYGSDGYNAQYRRHAEEDSERYAAYRQVHQDAWDKLRQSEDPQIRWIAEHCAEYSSEALEAIKHVPLTYRSARALQHENGWCGTFSTFLERAMSEGVITDPRTPERRALEVELLDWVGANAVAQILNYVNAVVASEAAVYVADPEAWRAKQEETDRVLRGTDEDEDEDEDY